MFKYVVNFKAENPRKPVFMNQFVTFVDGTDYGLRTAADAMEIS